MRNRLPTGLFALSYIAIKAYTDAYGLSAGVGYKLQGMTLSEVKLRVSEDTRWLWKPYNDALAYANGEQEFWVADCRNRIDRDVFDDPVNVIKQELRAVGK